MGSKPPAEAALFYRLSDIGIVLNDTRTNNFLYHSVPLKIIQYAAARKPVLTYPVAWAEDIPASNIQLIDRRDPQLWLDALMKLESYQWTEAEESFWQDYDWAVICRRLAAEIEAGL